MWRRVVLQWLFGLLSLKMILNLSVQAFLPVFTRPHIATIHPTALTMTEQPADPRTFREAEVMGLQYMQDGDYESALQGRFNEVVWAP